MNVFDEYDPKMIANEYEFLHISGRKRGGDQSFNRSYGDPRRIIFHFGMYIGNVLTVDKDSGFDAPDLDGCIDLIVQGIAASQTNTQRKIVISDEFFRD